MAAAASACRCRSLRQEMLTCPVCFEGYSEESRKPKMFECQHAVCEPCLRHMLAGGGSAGSRRRRIQCPICQREQVVSGSAVDAAGWPENLVIKQLVSRLGAADAARPAGATAASAGPAGEKERRVQWLLEELEEGMTLQEMGIVLPNHVDKLLEELGKAMQQR